MKWHGEGAQVAHFLIISPKSSKPPNPIPSYRRMPHIISYYACLMVFPPQYTNMASCSDWLYGTDSGLIYRPPLEKLGGKHVIYYVQENRANCP